MASRKRSRRKESEDDFDNDDDNDISDANDTGAKWACQSCTFQNRFGAFRCHVCGSRKGTSTRKARLSENVVEMQKTINDMVVKQVEKAKAIKRVSKAAVATPPSASEPAENASQTSVPAEKPVSPPVAPSTSSPSSTEITEPAPKKFKAEEVKSVEVPKKDSSISLKIDSNEVKCVIGIAKPPDAIVKVLPPQPNIKPVQSKVEPVPPKIEVPVKKLPKPVETTPVQPVTNTPSTSAAGPSTLSTPNTSRGLISPRVSPTTSRQSSETDSSSDSSTARSIEPPSNDRSPDRKASTRIPDYMIHREIPKKIIVVANGVPAIFYEFPRKIPGSSQAGPSF